MSHSVSLFFKVINYEQEYFVVVSISAASDARIYQINASKAEYMTMMVNSLSHEIITPISEILKHCDLPRIKMHPSHRNLPGNSKLQMTTPCFGVTVSSPDFKNSPGFTFGSQNRMVTPLHGLNLGSSRGLEAKSFGLTMQHAIGGERREFAGISPMQTGEVTPFTPFSILTKESHPSGTSIKPRSSPRSASPTNRAMDNDITQSKLRQSAYMINMEHMDIPDEDRYVGTCGLLAQQRKRFSMENSKLQHRVMSKEDSPSAILPMLSNAPVLEGMKQIKRIANRIQLFVDGLMGYSQILTQRFEPQVSNSYRVTDLLRETAELFEEKCAYKGISIEINCPLKLEINTDRKKLSSVFLIFLDNAVKFMNQKGRIVLSASCSSNKVSLPSGVPKPLPHQQTFIKNFTMREDSSPKGKQQMPFFEPESEERDIITFQIQDQGMGINKRDMEIIKYTLSNPFNTSPTSSSAGLGIGLRIAQAIISELSIGNGKLEIMSQIGEGTTVIFEIPTEPEIRAEELEPSIIETGLKKSDTIFNDQIQIEGRLNTIPQEEAVGEPTSSKILGGSERKILKSSLPHISNSDSLHSPAKASPVQASPKLHLEFKKSFSKTHTLATPMAGIRTPYDPASQNLVQLHSPSFADLASSFNRKSLPAHMASNTPKGTHLIDDSQIEPRSKKIPAEKARFSLRMDSMHHSKTIKTPDFHKRSNTRDSSKMIKFFTQGIAASLTSLFGQSETKKVMIVDDEVFLLEFLREILESLGLEVYTANSPERAFELTTSLGNMSKKINLVYMDYNMPNMNGAECTKILKSEVHKRVMEGAWFTVQTAQNDKLVRDQFKAVGVTDFLSKPYTFDQIVQHLKARGLLVEN